MAAPAPELLDLLPKDLRDIARLIGLPKTLVLVKHRGGRRFYFPVGVDPDHDLVGLIGREDAEVLCRAYPGERLEIPRAVGYARALRDLDILQRRARGVSQSTLAGEHGLTERQIRNIDRLAEDYGQMGLF